jgi:hypothetical protein
MHQAESSSSSFCLWTGLSLPVALHPASRRRSCLQLRTEVLLSDEDFHPIFGAYFQAHSFGSSGSASRPHGNARVQCPDDILRIVRSGWIRDLAAGLRGIEYEPSSVVSETLRRRTADLDFTESNTLIILGGTDQRNPFRCAKHKHDILGDAVASWIESYIGLTEDAETKLPRFMKNPN